MSRIGKDAAGQFILDHCRKENIDIQSLKQDVSIDTSINVGLVTEDGERTFVTNRNGSLWKLNIDDVDFRGFLRRNYYLWPVFSTVLYWMVKR